MRLADAFAPEDGAAAVVDGDLLLIPTTPNLFIALRNL